jgi:lysophospholipase L1-like esterase
MITVQPITIPFGDDPLPVTDIYLRVVVSRAFVGADGTFYGKSDRNPRALPQGWLRRALCTKSGGSLTLPSVTLPSTTDALDTDQGRLYAHLILADGTPFAWLGDLGDFSVKPSPSTTTWARIALEHSGGTIPATPAAPDAPTAMLTGANVTVTIPPVTGSTSFVVERSDDGGTTYTVIASGVSSPYTDAAAPPVTTVRYKARASNIGGDSAESPASNSVTTPAAPIALADAPGLARQFYIQAESPTDGASADVSITDRSSAAQNAHGHGGCTFHTAGPNGKAYVECPAGAYIDFPVVANARSIYVVLESLTGTSTAPEPPIGDNANGTYPFAGSPGETMFDTGTATGLSSSRCTVNTYVDTAANLLKPLQFVVLSIVTSGPVSVSTFANDRNAYVGKWRLAEMGVCTSAHNAVTQDAIALGLVEKYAISEATPLRSELIAVGDSQTGSWPQYVVNKKVNGDVAVGPAVTGVWCKNQFATSGYSLADLAAYDANVQAEINLHRKNCIVVLFAGGNDFIQGYTPAQTISHLHDRLAAYHAAGLPYSQMYFVTTPDRTGGTGIPSNWNTLRAQLKSLVDADTLGYHVTHVEDAPLIGADGANLNTTYFNGDKIHLADPGQRVLGGLVADNTPT